MNQIQQKAFDEFLERKRKNLSIKRKNNATLYAGSPMYFYCDLCGEEDSKPETFNSLTNPVQNPCDKCKQLLNFGFSKKFLEKSKLKESKVESKSKTNKKPR
jgi:hypothetical protein